LLNSGYTIIIRYNDSIIYQLMISEFNVTNIQITSEDSNKV
jgi:hypothetical protein